MIFQYLNSRFLIIQKYKKYIKNINKSQLKLAKMFVKLTTGDYRHVVEVENGVYTVQDSTGTQTKITPEQIEVHVTKWYQIIRLVLQFAGVLIGLFKKN